jgi:SAM-dependent methyltransferase
MLLEFSDSLDELRISAHGDELASVMGRDRDAAGNRAWHWPDTLTQLVCTLPHPVLVTDHHRLAQLAPAVRDTVFKLYESSVRITAFRGTRVVFEQRRWPGVWGPNIDTLVFCRALRPEVLAGAASVLEVGCGSGFISRHVLERAPQVRSLTMVDIHPGAVACSQEVVVDPRATALHVDGTVHLRSNPVDLLLCNPPYIPRPHAVGDNAYEGMGLLAFFIREALPLMNPGGRIITVISSVGDRVVKPLLEANPQVELTVLDEVHVPLKVLNVLNNPAWMAYLLEHGGLRRESRDGYDHWHTVRVCQLRLR